MLARSRAVLVLGLAVLVAGCGGDDKDAPADSSKSPVSGELREVAKDAALSPLIVSPAEPAVPFRGSSGKYLVSYELRLYNATPLELAPARVSVSTPDGEVLDKLSRREVSAALALPGRRSGVKSLSEAQQATLYETLEFDRRSEIPDRLVHRIAVSSPRLPRGRAVSAPVSVKVLDDFDVPVLGPPLQAGRGYVAADSCCSSERHRRALLAIANRQWLAQRFAVDWEQVDSSGRFVRRGGDPARPADYTIYGARAIAA
ncbi:MAG: hypothetical protein QOE31_2801, partial [Solirubrobacteraceae bacterium]|nr:hypothetical protein [Solirubrobacteraceae bacterium]